MSKALPANHAINQAKVTPRCQKLADSLGFELVDVEITKDDTGETLCIYIDKPEGISLDDCEKYHRSIQPQLEDIDYDFLEVSSPGADRPLKKDRDFERALGLDVEVKLYKPRDGQKVWQGVLSDWDKTSFTIDIGQEKHMLFTRKEAASVKPVIDMDGVEEVEFTDEENE